MSARHHATREVLEGELESDFVKFVKITDLPEVSDGDDSDGEEVHEGFEPREPKPMEKCLEKSAMLLSTGKDLVSGASGEDGEPETALQISEELVCSCSISSPLLSAMKGSREKQGASPRKMNVTWAPEVYDPIPTSISHSVKSKQKKSRKDRDRDNNNYKRRNGKKGQKSSSSRGGAGKDKKQFRKRGGRPDKGYKALDASDDPEDFEVGSPDYCGGSFLKKSVNNFHYPVAEAM